MTAGAKKPIALTRAGTSEVIAYACGECGIVAGSVMAHGDADARYRAVKCCAPVRCRRCDTPTGHRHRLLCRECEMHETWMRDAARFCKATPITPADYGDGYVFDDGRDEYEPSWEEAVERAEERAEEDPDAERAFFYYTCAPHGLPRIDASEMLADHCERHEMHEGATDALVDVDELQAAFDAWHAKQTVTSWSVDYSRVIVLDEAAAAEYRAEYARRLAAERGAP